MNQETALKSGYLYIPPQYFLRKTWLKKFCVLFGASQQGIQRLEIFENDDSFVKPSKIIPLNDCLKVAAYPQKQQANVFEVRKKDENHLFSSDTFQEMTEWLSFLQRVAFSKNIVPSTISEKQEENSLYSTIPERETFQVKIASNAASARNCLIGNYQLIVTQVNLSLAKEDGKVFLSWPYRHIRRYGCSAESFSFEAGRKCDSGEGVFTFETTAGSQIFQLVDSLVAQENKFLKLNQHRSSLSSIDTLPPVKKPPRKTKSTPMDSNCYSMFLDNLSYSDEKAHSSCTNKPFEQQNIPVQHNSVNEIIKILNHEVITKDMNVHEDYDYLNEPEVLRRSHNEHLLVQNRSSNASILEPDYINLDYLEKDILHKSENHSAENESDYAKIWQQL